MGNRGRFGKYGEVKRLKRLREAKALNLRDTFPRFAGGSWPAGNVPAPRKLLAHCLVIRSATKADAEFLAQLSDRVFKQYGAYHRIIPEWLETDMVWTLVALYKAVRVGFAMLGPARLSDKGSYTAELLAIAVDPPWQGRGAGTVLLRKILELAGKIGLGEVWLHTAKQNARARRVFENIGFVIIEEKPDFYTGGQDAVAMVKRFKGSWIGQAGERP